MFLRDHPQMNYRGFANWPPKWLCRGGAEKEEPPRGEVGDLLRVLCSSKQSRARIYLFIRHENKEYVGCLLFLDRIFCNRIFEVLTNQVGKKIAAISELDVDDRNSPYPKRPQYV